MVMHPCRPTTGEICPHLLVLSSLPSSCLHPSSSQTCLR